MKWNEDEKYPRGWENESVSSLASLLHWKVGRQARQGQSRSGRFSPPWLFPCLFSSTWNPAHGTHTLVRARKAGLTGVTGNAWLYIL